MNKTPTLLDFIIEIDRYNRTASKKIELQFTEQWVTNKLLSNG